MQITNNYSTEDLLINFIDTTLRTLFGSPITTERNYPAQNINNIQKLNTIEIKKAVGFLRVNHCGEVCAQALYQGQALTAQNYHIKKQLHQAAMEENDHLAWCKTRLTELNSHPSYLNPLWYAGALTIGIAAGIMGDKYNLGFLAETENQVSKHLESHLEKWPASDVKSKAIISQMLQDEQEHADTAIAAGGYPLSPAIKFLMTFSAKIMTTVTYYI